LQLPDAHTNGEANGDRRTTAAKREQHKQESTEKMLLGIFVIDIKQGTELLMPYKLST